METALEQFKSALAELEAKQVTFYKVIEGSKIQTHELKRLDIRIKFEN